MSSLESHYHINVAKHSDKYSLGVHYFAVDEVNKVKAETIFADLKVKFPDCNVSVTYWDIGGTSLDW
jgi:hypothetical protein